MNIEILQIAIELAKLMGDDGVSAKKPDDAFTPHIGVKSIIRTYASGVFFGVVTSQSGRMVEIANCRRLWSWKASESISLSAVAVHGVSSGKFSPIVQTQTVLDALEIIPCSMESIAKIEAVKDAVQS